jgi:hypothetical protein
MSEYSYTQLLKSRQLDRYDRIEVSDRDTTAIDIQKIIRSYQQEIDDFTRPIQCVRCGWTYTREDNLQARACWNHINTEMVWDRTGTYKVWKCCGEHYTSTGCRRSLHYMTQESVRAVQLRPTYEHLSVPAILVDLDILRCDKNLIDNYDVVRSDENRQEYHIKCIGFQFEDFFFT